MASAGVPSTTYTYSPTKGVTINGTYYSPGKVSALAGSGNRVFSAKDQLAIAAYQRYLRSKPKNPAKPVSAFSGSSIINPSSRSTPGKPAIGGVPTGQKPLAPSSGYKSTSTSPASYTSSGGGGGGGGGYGQNFVQPTINPYTMRSDDVLRNEASQAAAGIYNPIMNALRQRQADYEKARLMGREDLAAQYAQQIADLKALALSADTQIQQQKASTSQGYETGMANLAQQSLSARNTNAEQYGAVQGTMEDQLKQLGVTNQFAPAASGILKDKSFTDAMLQGIGNIGQTGLTAGKTASDTAMSQLAANNTSQFAGLQGQAGIVKDQGLRDIDMKSLENVMQGQAEIGKTQSDWNSKAYELLKALQGTEWEKYMGAGGASFDQGTANAQLGLSAADVASKAQADATANLDPVSLAYYKLSQMGNMSEAQKKGYTDVLGLLTSPINISKVQPAGSNPFGDIAAGMHPALQSFAGDPGSAHLKDDAYARAWNSLLSRGLVSESAGANDPNWQQFRTLMDAVMTGNKNYNLGAL